MLRSMLSYDRETVVGVDFDFVLLGPGGRGHLAFGGSAGSGSMWPW